MSYHKFLNLREIFQGDLTNKVLDGVQSMDFMDQDCNCNTLLKVEGKCVYKGQCRKSLVIYKVTCKECGECYIGNTQQNLKKRIDQHLGEVVQLVNHGKKSDSFASHFVRHFWAKGYCVSTVGLDEDKVRTYIKRKREKDKRIEQLKIW